MSDICNDNRFEMIEKYCELLKESTNIETSYEEMQVIDNILFRFWQMGWLDKIEFADNVVRCKDCKYFDVAENIQSFDGFCHNYISWVKRTDFCSYGERRESE